MSYYQPNFEHRPTKHSHATPSRVSEPLKTSPARQSDSKNNDESPDYPGSLNLEAFNLNLSSYTSNSRPSATEAIESRLEFSPNVYNNKRVFQLDQILTENYCEDMEPYRSFHRPINARRADRDTYGMEESLDSSDYMAGSQPPQQGRQGLERRIGSPSNEYHYGEGQHLFQNSPLEYSAAQGTMYDMGESNEAYEPDYPTTEFDEVYDPPLPTYPSNNTNSPVLRRRGLYRKNTTKRTTEMEEDRTSILSVELGDHNNMMDVLATIRIKRKSRKSLRRSVKKRGEDEFDSEEEIEEQTGLPSLKRPHLQTLREKLQARVSTQELAEGLRGLEEEVGLKSIKQKFKKAWQRKKGDIKGYMYQLELWASTFKEIEGKFGTATASYFRFTRWLMFLNVYIFLITIPVIVLPTLFSKNVDFASDYNKTNITFVGLEQAVNCSINYDQHIDNLKNNESTTDKVLNFFKGTGWMERTHLFYGLYHNLTFTESDTDEEDHTTFDIGLGYLLAIGFAFIISFLLIVKNSGKSVKEGVMDQEDSHTMYCNKVFSAWDFCIYNEKAATIKHANICYEFKADLEEQRLRLRQADRSTTEKCRLYTVRFFINTFVVVFLGASLYLIYWTSDSLLVLQKREMSDALALIIEFLPSITITFLNVIIPLIFSKIVMPEDYSPVFELKITLFRTVLLRLASLGVLLFSLYYQVLSTDGAKCISSSSNLCCGNKQWTNTDSVGSIKCWETYIGQQIYKLALLDFAVVLIVTFLYEFPRTLIYTKYKDKKIMELIGEQEFDLPKNVLDIVYSQTICWLGMFFCPLIPLITMLKCFVVFYVKKLSLVRNCVPTKRPYKASRSNSFFMTVLLISFILSAVPLGYMIGNIPPSQSCGPFRVYSRISEYYMFDVIRGQIETWHPIAETIFSFLGTVGFFLPAIILLCLVMYGYWAAAQGYKKKQQILKDQLKLEGKDRQFLLARVNDVIKRGDLSRDTSSRRL